jgi:ribonuclease HII
MASTTEKEERWLQMAEFDQSLLTGSVKYLIGVDEAGRGCLAGRIYAAAVILTPYTKLLGVNDSKKLTPAQRKRLAEEIKEVALAWGVAWCSEKEIDKNGIEWANKVAFTRAIRKMLDKITVNRKEGLAIIDGNRQAIRCPFPQKVIVQGDAKSLSIAAASILAKTDRDRYCREVMDPYHPHYGFRENKGYATPGHLYALAAWGPCKYHRCSFSWKA